jgi:hypothetical protein
VASVALAAQPAIASVAVSLMIRKTTSSVSNRLAYSVNPTHENQMTVNKPAKTPAPRQLRSLRNAVASSATTST